MGCIGLLNFRAITFYFRRRSVLSSKLRVEAKHGKGYSSALIIAFLLTNHVRSVEVQHHNVQTAPSIEIGPYRERIVRVHTSRIQDEVYF